MSWFTDLASKAEAMLVKLDQDTAQALQSANLQTSSAKSTDSDIGENNNAYPVYYDESNKGQADDPTVRFATDQTLTMPLNEKEFDTGTADQVNDVEGTNGISNDKTADTSDFPLAETNGSFIELEDKHVDANERELNKSQLQPTPENNTAFSTQHSTFKLETSKLKPNLYHKQISTQANGRSKSSKRNTQIISLGADDIRASINRSLQEYSLASSRERLTNHEPESTSHSSHFDDQPNLIRHTGPDDNDQTSRLHSSPSFSIDVPEDQDTDITSRILKQGPLNKRTPFNLHKVINRLASHRGHSQSLLGDKTKIRLRRAQMRAASFLRRMNYYFQAYPTMKYWMIGYLVILQILVVYVLFFYQSSGSSNYLTEQVKHQQADLNEESQPPKK